MLNSIWNFFCKNYLFLHHTYLNLSNDFILIPPKIIKVVLGEESIICLHRYLLKIDYLEIEAPSFSPESRQCYGSALTASTWNVLFYLTEISDYKRIHVLLNKTRQKHLTNHLFLFFMIMTTIKFKLWSKPPYESTFFCKCVCLIPFVILQISEIVIYWNCYQFYVCFIIVLELMN